MSNEIKPIYPDKSGNTHDTRAQAKKANRLIDAAESFACEALDIQEIHLGEVMASCLVPHVGESLMGVAALEYARSVVAIYGMKDKPAKGAS